MKNNIMAMQSENAKKAFSKHKSIDQILVLPFTKNKKPDFKIWL
ncbi:hypothetical protein OD917_10955 [Flavobacterium sp. SH_e]|nr:hypothetical protein [Flavobacterium sp. SH_e]MCV2485445.1 hypothetical protein [Flavobacterium sp. SH_e]